MNQFWKFSGILDKLRKWNHSNGTWCLIVRPKVWNCTHLTSILLRYYLRKCCWFCPSQCPPSHMPVSLLEDFWNEKKEATQVNFQLWVQVYYLLSNQVKVRYHTVTDTLLTLNCGCPVSPIRPRGKMINLLRIWANSVNSFNILSHEYIYSIFLSFVASISRSWFSTQKLIHLTSVSELTRSLTPLAPLYSRGTATVITGLWISWLLNRTHLILELSAFKSSNSFNSKFVLLFLSSNFCILHKKNEKVK